MHISSAWQQRASSLKEKFCQFGECGQPFIDKTHKNLPEPMNALLTVAGEWHIMPDHFGVFGFNLFDNGTFLNKTLILGDEDLVKEWKDEHSSPNCAEEAWECFAAVSEYDYLFVCVDYDSPHYGYTRHIVNNCWEDNSLLDASFDVFFEKLEMYTDEWLKQYNSTGEDSLGVINFFSGC